MGWIKYELLPKAAESPRKVKTKHVGTLSRKTSCRLMCLSYSFFFTRPTSGSFKRARTTFSASTIYSIVFFESLCFHTKLWEDIQQRKNESFFHHFSRILCFPQTHSSEVVYHEWCKHGYCN